MASAAAGSDAASSAGAGAAPVLPPESLAGACSHCGASGAGVKLLFCSRCHRERYCTVDCQRAAWKGHKAGCHAYSESKKLHQKPTVYIASASVIDPPPPASLAAAVPEPAALARVLEQVRLFLHPGVDDANGSMAAHHLGIAVRVALATAPAVARAEGVLSTLVRRLRSGNDPARFYCLQLISILVVAGAPRAPFVSQAGLLPAVVAILGRVGDLPSWLAAVAAAAIAVLGRDDSVEDACVAAALAARPASLRSILALLQSDKVEYRVYAVVLLKYAREPAFAPVCIGAGIPAALAALLGDASAGAPEPANVVMAVRVVESLQALLTAGLRQRTLAESILAAFKPAFKRLLKLHACDVGSRLWCVVGSCLSAYSSLMLMHDPMGVKLRKLQPALPHAWRALQLGGAAAVSALNLLIGIARHPGLAEAIYASGIPADIARLALVDEVVKIEHASYIISAQAVKAGAALITDSAYINVVGPPERERLRAKLAAMSQAGFGAALHKRLATFISAGPDLEQIARMEDKLGPLWTTLEAAYMYTLVDDELTAGLLALRGALSFLLAVACEPVRHGVIAETRAAFTAARILTHAAWHRMGRKRFAFAELTSEAALREITQALLVSIKTDGIDESVKFSLGGVLAYLSGDLALHAAMHVCAPALGEGLAAVFASQGVISRMTMLECVASLVVNDVGCIRAHLATAPDDLLAWLGQSAVAAEATRERAPGQEPARGQSEGEEEEEAYWRGVNLPAAILHVLRTEASPSAHAAVERLPAAALQAIERDGPASLAAVCARVPPWAPRT